MRDKFGPITEGPKLCKVCNDPSEEGKDFCSKRCKDFYNKAIFFCPICHAKVQFKDAKVHAGRPCLEVRMKDVEREIAHRQTQLESLRKEWENTP